jgi:hypothetical protein
VLAKSIEARTRIDEFLPDYDFRAVYQIPINAARSVVYECLLQADFTDLRLTRLLMFLRRGKRMPRQERPGGLFQSLHGTGFVVLEEVLDDEIVIGVAGRFWRPDGERCMDLTAAEFNNFSRTGFAKAAWNFVLRAGLTETEITILSTETRIQCFGPRARWKFRIYWGLVGPFSGLIRREMLKVVRIKAESKIE